MRSLFIPTTTTMTTLLLALLLAACGSSSTTATGSCDTTSINQACIDYSGSADVVSPYETQCSGSSGSWSNGPCNRSGSVGGCQTTDASLGLTSTTWLFPPNTAASTMDACQAPDTFVTP